MAYVRIRPRRSTAEEWDYHNPILAEGEMGVEVPPTGVGTGTVKIKFGDGVTAWRDLPYGLSIDEFEKVIERVETTIETLPEDFITSDSSDIIETEEIPDEEVEEISS